VFNKTHIFINIFNLTNKIYKSIDNIIKTVNERKVIFLYTKNCEVSIHDLTQPESSVVYVAKGTVTDRKEGQSFDHLIRQVLLSKRFKDDFTVNYDLTLSYMIKEEVMSFLPKSSHNEISDEKY
jgi:predicted transcriptional regulator YheO